MLDGKRIHVNIRTHAVDKLYTTITTRYSVKMQYKIVREPVSPWFVGRETLLGDIRETFTKGLNDPFAFQPTVIVFSAGFGQGKTQVALRYSCIRKVYRGVFWISAFSEGNVIRDLEAIAVRIKMPLGSTWKAVLEELASWEDPWLMVFNVWADVSKFSTPLASFFPSGTSNAGVSLPHCVPTVSTLIQAPCRSGVSAHRHQRETGSPTAAFEDD
jgi:hypothetical protein